MAKNLIQIPFDRKGNLQGYPEDDAVWKDNFEFEETLQFDRFERGRSAAHAVFRAKNGREYQMFLSNLGDVVSIMIKGVLSGRFTFVKKGMNYGIERIESSK